jgi:hypothetical protein
MQQFAIISEMHNDRQHECIIDSFGILIRGLIVVGGYIRYG